MLLQESLDATLPEETPAGFTMLRAIFASLHQGRRMAVAASVAGLLMGASIFVVVESMAPSPDNGGTVSMTTPVSLEGFVQRHDQMEVSHESSPDVLRGDGQTARDVCRQMQQRLTVTVPSVDLSQFGWTFVGAKVCPLGSCCAGQLFFERGDQALSVFVMPADALPQALRSRGCLQLDGRMVTVRKVGDVALLVVGHCPSKRLTTVDMVRLADSLAGE
jgi:hypothetical protein